MFAGKEILNHPGEKPEGGVYETIFPEALLAGSPIYCPGSF
jgi:hypothetical protein